MRKAIAAYDNSGSIGLRGLSAGEWLPFLALVFLFLSPPISATEPPRGKNVLVLSGGHGHASIDLMESSLRSRVPWPVNFSVADLENPQFEDKSYQDSLAESLRRAYSGDKLDLLIALMDPYFRFALQHRDMIFPGVPIIFMSVSSPLADRKMPPGATGVASPLGMRETIKLALHLHPDANAVAVITSGSETEKEDLAAAHTELLRHQDKVKEIDLVGPPSGQMLERVAALPPHTVVLFELIPQDSNQPAIGVYDVLAATTRRLPTYSTFPGLALDRGGIGGAYYDATQDAVLAGELGARVLSGERPDNIPVVHNSNPQIRLDWRQLQRWHIPESALPAGSVLLYREPTLWKRDRKYFLPALGVIALQFLLILGLLWQRARRRSVEAVLRESERRFRVMADNTPAQVWMVDERGKIVYLNERRLAFTAADPNAGLGSAWSAYVHPDDLKNVVQAFSQALKNREAFSMEYRLRRHDGSYRWMFDVASPRVKGDGAFAGFVGSAVDITDQKLAQEALKKVSGRLIEAQEQERGRIARELHDDVCQRLALLAIGIERASKGQSGYDMSVSDQLEDIYLQCVELSRDVQKLSHGLHPANLDQLGLVSAIKSLCRRFSEESGTTAVFTHKDIPESIPREISISLFRVTQEALHNSAKYSGEKHFEVHLQGMPGEIVLEVRDRGVGFDAASVKSKGLGLVSMAERIDLVNGRITIDSKLNIGTRICARVPLASHPRAMATANN